MRAAIFIDGGYILNQFKMNKVNPDYSRMAEHFLAPLRKDVPLDLLRVYFYYCPPWMSPEPTEDERRRMEAHEKFSELLESQSRWTIRLGKLQRRFEGNKEVYEQKRVDVLLSCDMVRHTAAHDIQHAVLIAGDSDFIPAVQAAKDSGATVTLWCGALNTVHKELITTADEVHHFEWRRFPRIPEAKASSPQKKEAAAAASLTAKVAPPAPAGADTPPRATSSRRRRRRSSSTKLPNDQT